MDFGLAPYVKKSFKKALLNKYKEYLYFQDEETLKSRIDYDRFELLDFNVLTYTKDRSRMVPNPRYPDESPFETIEVTDYIAIKLGIDDNGAKRIYNLACKDVEEETKQAMEAMIHNFNTLHSRAGGQVPFSSVNFGCDTSEEGRLISDKLLDAVWNGLGNGETAIFPISIFQIKSGINYNPEDPNYDLFKKSIKVSAKRLFPNFVNEDAPYNIQYYKKSDYNSLVAVMGCRTRTMGNVNGPEESGSRGNFAFNTINLPYCALLAREEYPSDEEGRIKRFYEIFDNLINLSKEYLEFRYNIISHKKVKNFPFLMQNGVWMDSEKLGPEDEIAPVLKHASLSIGFCGLAEALVALVGSHHGETEEAKKLGLEIITHLRNTTDRFTTETHMNWSTFSTPAESTAGSFMKKCKQRFGIVPGVTEREYFTNSFHKMNVA